MKIGSVVLVDYAGGFLNGTLFDTSIREAAERAGILDQNRAYQPIQVTIGSGQVIVGFEEALIGMKAGDTKTARIPPEKGYGFYNEDSVNVIPLSEFGNQTGNIKEGARLIMVSPQGRVPVLIKKVGKENVTIDFNHPLANQTLVFAILVREVN